MPPWLHFDLTVTLGALIQIVSTLGGLILAFVKIRERLVRIETQVEPLWGQFCRDRDERGTGGTEE